MSPGPEAYDLNGNRAKSCGISVPSLFFGRGRPLYGLGHGQKLANDVEPARFFPTLTKSGILSGNALTITVDESRYSTSYVWQVRIEATIRRLLLNRCGRRLAGGSRRTRSSVCDFCDAPKLFLDGHSETRIFCLGVATGGCP